MSEDSNDKLRPATFEPRSEAPVDEGVQAQERFTGVWLIGGVGVVLLALVVFVLPMVAPEPVATETAASRTPESALNSAADAGRSGASSEASTSDLSPFAEAQFAKERRSAQDALQALLEIQSRLETLAVNEWAGDAFTAAIATAVEGDTYYRDRNFSEAEARYLDALDALTAIEIRLPDEVSKRLSKLLDAIESTDYTVANPLAEELLTIAPDRSDVFDASQRVPLIPEVADSIEAAALLAAETAFASALQAIRDARALDPAHQRLIALESGYADALNNQQFQNAMTLGFSALEAKEYDAARRAFETAQARKPGDNSPSIAIAQVEDGEIISALNRLLTSATQLEKNEQWEDVVTAYADALALDPSLVQASEGLAKAKPMASLFSQLSAIVDNPPRLVGANALSEAQISVKAAEEVVETTGKMPKLQVLLERATAIVRVASAPLPVTISSDALTEITIKRVARLGRISSRVVSLRPGQYQVLGSRNGYRDVLVTLNVNTESSNQIDVRCEEPINR